MLHVRIYIVRRNQSRRYAAVKTDTAMAVSLWICPFQVLG